MPNAAVIGDMRWLPFFHKQWWRLTNLTSNMLNRNIFVWSNSMRGRRGRDRLVVGFITTYAISDYHH